MSRHAFGALAAALLFSAGAQAADMSKGEYKAAGERIAIDYKAAKAACKSLSGNARDICKSEAEAQSKTGKADLLAAYEPSVNNSYKAAVKRAEAEYSVAKERCDDSAGNIKDVCVKEAKAIEVAALADAKAKMKVTKTNKAAAAERNEARQDAASDKRDADYAVAKQKCDAYAAEAKTHCMGRAKAEFGKS